MLENSPMATIGRAVCASTASAVTPSTPSPSTRATPRMPRPDMLLNVQNLFLFGLRHLIDLLDVPVRHLLHVIQLAALLVLADQLVLHHLFEMLVRVASGVP